MARCEVSFRGQISGQCACRRVTLVPVKVPPSEILWGNTSLSPHMGGNVGEVLLNDNSNNGDSEATPTWSELQN